MAGERRGVAPTLRDAAHPPDPCPGCGHDFPLHYEVHEGCLGTPLDTCTAECHTECAVDGCDCGDKAKSIERLRRSGGAGRDR